MTEQCQIRDNILQRLRNNRMDHQTATSRVASDSPDWDKQEKIHHFTQRIAAVHGEVHLVDKNLWLEAVKQQLQDKQLKRVLLAENAMGRQISEYCQESQITWYSDEIENFKDKLFNEIDASVTGCKAAIAETGSLVLWPDNIEPRLMSLVPPVHIVLLDAENIFSSLADIINQQNWQNKLPSNALLISGPSKTADIEQTLAYGIHGPKKLVVIILDELRSADDQL